MWALSSRTDSEIACLVWCMIWVLGQWCACSWLEDKEAGRVQCGPLRVSQASALSACFRFGYGRSFLHECIRICGVYNSGGAGVGAGCCSMHAWLQKLLQNGLTAPGSVRR